MACKRGGDFALGQAVRKRISQSVRFEVDESGALKKATDVDKLMHALATVKASAETLPFLDTLLLAVSSNQRIARLLGAYGDGFAAILNDFALDRQCAVRVLTFGKILEFTDHTKFLLTARKLIDETIDPQIKQAAIETAAHIDALTVLHAAVQEPVVKSPSPSKKRGRDDDAMFDPPEERKMRNLKEYREARKMAKKMVSEVPNFEKVLKDTVASICFERVGQITAFGEEVPEWRKTYRIISTILLEKEARLPEDVRFKCQSDEDKARIVKRVSQFTHDYLSKHVVAC